MVWSHYGDVIIDAIASQITSLTIVYSIVYSDADQRKHQSSASLAFVRRIHRGPMNSPHKWPVTWKMFPFDDVIMYCIIHCAVIDHVMMNWTKLLKQILFPTLLMVLLKYPFQSLHKFGMVRFRYNMVSFLRHAIKGQPISRPWMQDISIFMIPKPGIWFDLIMVTS